MELEVVGGERLRAGEGRGSPGSYAGLFFSCVQTVHISIVLENTVADNRTKHHNCSYSAPYVPINTKIGAVSRSSSLNQPGAEVSKSVL